jgi:hypothetical protein
MHRDLHASWNVSPWLSRYQETEDVELSSSAKTYQDI